ncbi:MAG: leucyl aminopeptidase [Nitrospinota bacterium]
MREDMLARGAHKLAADLARVRPGEEVLVVTEYGMTSIAERVARAASALGGRVVTAIVPPFRGQGEDFPPGVAAAMREAAVLFMPLAVSMSHTPAVHEARRRGARAIMMSDWTDEMFASPALVETDFAAQAVVVRRLGAILSGGRRFRLTTPRGTDLRFESGGRRANELTDIPGPGEIAPVPTIEVNFAPLEGTAEGTLVVDASIPFLGVGPLREPIALRVERGFVTKVEGGGEQGRRFEAGVSAHGDPNCWNVAEFGIGLNPNARITGRALMDEGVMNTAHVAIGTSRMLGGAVTAAAHYDMVFWEPTLEIDGKIVYRGDKILA